MKTTIEIPDALLRQAKRLAAQERTTLRALVEEGLRRITAERHRGRPFKPRKVSLRGQNLQRGMAGASWPEIRDAAYEGQGARSPSIPTFASSGPGAKPKRAPAGASALGLARC